jgi:hypothetical protein
MRHLNDWQIQRVMKMRGPDKDIAQMAFGLGMSVHQFKRLPADRRRAAVAAFHKLTDPLSMDGMNALVREAQIEAYRPPRRYERLSEERMIELGTRLLEVKARLSHGRFRLWVDEESGITYSQAQKWMQKARAQR